MVSQLKKPRRARAHKAVGAHVSCGPAGSCAAGRPPHDSRNDPGAARPRWRRADRNRVHRVSPPPRRRRRYPAVAVVPGTRQSLRARAPLRKARRRDSVCGGCGHRPSELLSAHLRRARVLQGTGPHATFRACRRRDSRGPRRVVRTPRAPLRLRNASLQLGAWALKHFQQPSEAQAVILASAEELGWPPWFDDPLPRTAGANTKVRLHNTINNLNRNLHLPIVRFRGDGTGTRIGWELR